MSSIPICPGCGAKLCRVTQSASSPLNAYQFDAVKAGDWYCEVCPSNGRGNRPYRYYWNRELPPPPSRIEAAAAAIANARGGRRGAPPVANILELLPPNLRDEVMEDARAALDAAEITS